MRKTLAVVPLLVLLLLAAGCGAPARDVSTPGKALLGHWKQTIPGSGEVYYGPRSVTYVKGNQRPVVVDYKVLEENSRQFTIRVAYPSQAEEPRPAKLAFSKDRMKLYAYPDRMPEMLAYDYVDSKLKP